MLAVLVAVSSAFSPTALAPRSAVSLRVRSVSAPVAMAGWNDQYQDDDPGRKKQVRALCVTHTAPLHTHTHTHTYTHGQAHAQSVGRAVAGAQEREERFRCGDGTHWRARRHGQRPAGLHRTFVGRRGLPPLLGGGKLSVTYLPSSAVLTQGACGPLLPLPRHGHEKQVLCWLEALYITGHVINDPLGNSARRPPRGGGLSFSTHTRVSRAPTHTCVVRSVVGSLSRV